MGKRRAKSGDKVEFTPELVALTDIPFDASQPPQGFAVHIDCRITGEEATALRRIYSALDRTQATLSNDTRITTYNGGLRWILQQLNKAMAVEDSATEDAIEPDEADLPDVELENV
jgi:hypothetical protein